MIIFDLDGTLADITHRRPLVDKQLRGKANWPEFFRQCVNDTPIAPVIDLFRVLHRAHKHLQIWSGRSDEVYWDTVNWLSKYLFHGSISWMEPDHHDWVRLRMRPAGDTCPDVELKERMLDDALAQFEEIEFVVDDRQRVVDMWRRRGILCLQCAEGDY